MTRRLVLAGGALAGLLVVGGLMAAPVLHEYFDIDAAKSAAAGAEQAGDSAMAETPAATTATNAQAQREAQSRTPSESSGPHASSDPNRYRLDSDTSRPDTVGYDDPFTPSIPPFKRLVAYDAVNRLLELVVADRGLSPVPIGGRAQAGEDQFYGAVDLSPADGLVRIPSVGPMARVLGAKLTPSGELAIFADSADNWFLDTKEKKATHLVFTLSINRDVFGSKSADPTWEDLASAMPPLPQQVDRAAEPVLEHLGVSRVLSPRQAVDELVAYFRAFAPSEERRAAKGPELYEEIALSQAGVCRHRSFAFVITALALGLPTRFVHNEAHAWVEVYDSRIWHRIDLGGAAGDVQFGELDVPHVAPPDPHQWPANSESGQDMVQGASSGAGGTEVSRDGPVTGNDAEGSQDAEAEATGDSAELAPPAASDVESAGAAGDEPSTAPEDTAELDGPGDTAGAPEQAATIRFRLVTEQAVRGAPVTLSGRVAAGDRGCPLRKVKVMLADAAGKAHILGVLVTDADGRFGGEVVVGAGIPVGDHDLYVTSPGDDSCGPADSR